MHRLPAVPDSDKIACPSAKPMSMILLADDSPHAQRMGERILREEGFEVASVTDEAAALVRMRRRRSGPGDRRRVSSRPQRFRPVPPHQDSFTAMCA